jgi:hypothetical protein
MYRWQHIRQQQIILCVIVWYKHTILISQEVYNGIQEQMEYGHHIDLTWGDTRLLGFLILSKPQQQGLLWEGQFLFPFTYCNLDISLGDVDQDALHSCLFLTCVFMLLWTHWLALQERRKLLRSIVFLIYILFLGGYVLFQSIYVLFIVALVDGGLWGLSRRHNR